MPSREQRQYGFKSVAHRKAMFRNEPGLAKNIANKYGARAGGGFTRAQIGRRISEGLKNSK